MWDLRCTPDTPAFRKRKARKRLYEGNTIFRFFFRRARATLLSGVRSIVDKGKWYWLVGVLLLGLAVPNDGRVCVMDGVHGWEMTRR